MSGYRIHQIHLQRQELVYIPIPKNACSSIKHALYNIEFDQAFDSQKFRKHGYRNMHDYYRKRFDAYIGVKKLVSKKDLTIFSVIRDPIKRLISCYSNRVVDLKDLEKSKIILGSKGLQINPDLNTFILKLHDYRRANNVIRHHSCPQHVFLGNTLEYIDKIYPIEKLEMLTDMLKKYKTNLVMPTIKTRGANYGLADLSAEALEHAIEFCKEDYDLFRDYYTPAKIRLEHNQALAV